MAVVVGIIGWNGLRGNLGVTTVWKERDIPALAYDLVLHWRAEIGMACSLDIGL